MKQGLFTVPFLVLGFIGIIAYADSKSKHDLTVLGSVVAYDQLAPLTDITFAPQVERVVVRVDKRLAGQEASRFILVTYSRFHDSARLPKEVFNSQNRWRFLLVRDSSCDALFGALQQTSAKPTENEISLPHFKPTAGANLDEIPIDKTLPCYLLRKGDLRPYKD